MSDQRYRGNQGRMVNAGIIGFVILMLLVLFSSATFLTIDAGERGVLFRRFGGGIDTTKVYPPGFQVLAPWNKMYVYDVREKQVEEQMEVLSSNGLNIKLDITLRINPKYNKIGQLHDNFGEDYVNSLVRPEVRSTVKRSYRAIYA